MTREEKRNRAQEEKTIYSLSRRLDEEEDKEELKVIVPSSANPSEQWCEFTPVPFSPASSSSKSLNVLGTTTFSPPPPFCVVVVALVVVFVLLLLRLCVPPPPKNMIDVCPRPSSLSLSLLTVCCVYQRSAFGDSSDYSGGFTLYSRLIRRTQDTKDTYEESTFILSPSITSKKKMENAFRIREEKEDDEEDNGEADIRRAEEEEEK